MSAFAAGCINSAKSKLLTTMVERSLIVMDSPSVLRPHFLMPFWILGVYSILDNLIQCLNAPPEFSASQNHNSRAGEGQAP
jgi:hypothetical protein